jgi:hypothetical protein
MYHTCTISRKWGRGGRKSENRQSVIDSRKQSFFLPIAAIRQRSIVSRGGTMLKIRITTVYVTTIAVSGSCIFH